MQLLKSLKQAFVIFGISSLTFAYAFAAKPVEVLKLNGEKTDAILSMIEKGIILAHHKQTIRESIYGSWFIDDKQSIVFKFIIGEALL